MATYDEKLTHIGDKPTKNVFGNAGSYANVVRNGQTNTNVTCINEAMYGNEDDTEYME